MEFSLEQAVRERYSTRTYDDRSLEPAVKERLLAYAAKLSNPLGPKIRVQWVDRATVGGGEKLGTYGFIRGARSFLAVTVPALSGAAEALGYQFEQLVLYATSLGLGTCWLGGTFQRSAFAARIEIGEGELFPILSPIGYPAERPRKMEQLFRRALQADGRKPWDALFFHGDFSVPLTQAEAGDYALPLELLRLAPSAVNHQPWRVVLRDGAFHFFVKRTAPAELTAVDMQKIDLGIAICHFHLAALQQGLSGHFLCQAPDVTLPWNTEYLISWIPG